MQINKDNSRKRKIQDSKLAAVFSALIRAADADPAKETKAEYKLPSELPHQQPTESAISSESGVHGFGHAEDQGHVEQTSFKRK